MYSNGEMTNQKIEENLKSDEKEFYSNEEEDQNYHILNSIEIPDIRIKTAKKWVYFDVITGKVKFQYGGIQEATIV
jgi:hypothetical protein